MLSAGQVATTVDGIVSAQQPDGMIPWYPGGHGDPWNHVEAAMALSLDGRRTEAELAYLWLAALQRADGSWYAAYHRGSVVDRRRDTNAAAYVAVGVWHHYLSAGDVGFLDTMFPVVERGLGFALGLQQPSGEVLWCVEPGGSPGRYALLTASSCIYFSLRCAIAAADALGRACPEWELAAGRLAQAVAHSPHCFEPKHRFAMDWYYPVLCGALDAERARARLRQGWPAFVMDGLGVRCVSDHPWVTAAETAECALAFLAAGLPEEAALLLAWSQHLRREDGRYWTGCVHPEEVHFPGDEHSTYSAAAVVLANHTLAGRGASAGLFRGRGLPRRLDLGEPAEISHAGAHPPQHP